METSIYKFLDLIYKPFNDWELTILGSMASKTVVYIRIKEISGRIIYDFKTNIYVGSITLLNDIITFIPIDTKIINKSINSWCHKNKLGESKLESFATGFTRVLKK